MMRRSILVALAACSLLGARPLAAQEGGAAALGELVQGLGVNVRVLLIAAHPDDEDTPLITWLARGRHVETAYLSLTRGDGGQNLIGNELGEALGAIRTEELLAARRLDGGHQYFTRAYDFGFSKSATETFAHWPKDSILRDVVTVVRAFKPHVIVAVFSGTSRDGHGHHQVSGLLAREAYDVAGDSARLPPSLTQGFPPWTPLKLYRRAWPGGGIAPTLRIDVGEYSALRGRSYAELAAESRSQHKSQAFGSLQRKGAVIDELGLEASRVARMAGDGDESSLFAGIDTTWGRVRGALPAAARRALDSIPDAAAAVRRAYDPFAPGLLIRPLARLRRLALDALSCPAAARTPHDPGCRVEVGNTASADADAALTQLISRADRALVLASGVAVEVEVGHETWAAGEAVPVSVSFYNRGDRRLSVSAAVGGLVQGAAMAGVVEPGGTARLRDTIRPPAVTQPWWLARPRRGDLFSVPVVAVPEDARHDVAATIVGTIDDAAGGGATSFELVEPVVYRAADPIAGEIDRPIAIVPAVTIAVAQPVQYVAANRPFERVLRVEVRSASDHPRAVRVSLQLPPGVLADSVSRTVGLPDHAGAFGPEGEQSGMPGRRAVAAGSPMRAVEFRVRGTLPEGRYLIAAVAESEGQRFTSGYTLVDYPHIRPRRLFHEAAVALSAVTVSVPSGLRVAYVPGVGDNVAPMLPQLGIPVTVIEPEKVASADLSGFTTIVVGPRAYESNAALVAANPRLLRFAHDGGTLVVQYGQFEMAAPGMMPFPITFARPADRVTEEDAPVRVTDPASPLLRVPNRIGAADWQGWVQERALYMPRAHDARYRTLLAMNDPGEPPNDGAILVAPVGTGTYVYTTLALFRQLPAGVPGAARLFVNLLGADQRAAGPPPPLPRP
jgi:LmbE family N-acetylglucosaminyl deacetylase